MPDESQVTALIVDDDIDMRLLVRVVLDAAGLGINVVAEAVDASDAMAALDRLDPPPVPTMVILDNRMPGMSGLEVAKLMRRRSPAQHIILFSAFVTPEISAQAREVGIDACLTKEDLMELPNLVIELTRPDEAE